MDNITAPIGVPKATTIPTHIEPAIASFCSSCKRSSKNSIFDKILPTAAVIWIKAASNPIPSPEILTKIILSIFATIVDIDSKLWYSTPERTDLISGIPDPTASGEILSQIKTASKPHIILTSKNSQKLSPVYSNLRLNWYKETLVITRANKETIVLSIKINK